MGSFAHPYIVMVWSKFHPYRCSGISKTVLTQTNVNCESYTSLIFHQYQIKEQDHTRPCGMDDNAKCVLAQASYLSKAHIFQWPAEYMRNKWDNIGNIPV